MKNFIKHHTKANYASSCIFCTIGFFSVYSILFAWELFSALPASTFLCAKYSCIYNTFHTQIWCDLLWYHRLQNPLLGDFELVSHLVCSLHLHSWTYLLLLQPDLMKSQERTFQTETFVKTFSLLNVTHIKGSKKPDQVNKFGQDLKFTRFTSQRCQTSLIFLKPKVYTYMCILYLHVR